MNLENKMIDGTAMVSYLNYRKSLCTIKNVGWNWKWLLTILLVR